MAESKVNFLQDIALPVFAFLSSAYSPQGAVAAQALTGALSIGQRRRAGKREDARLDELMAMRRQEGQAKSQALQQRAAQERQEFEAGAPARELEAAQLGFQRENLQDVMGRVGRPVETGVPAPGPMSLDIPTPARAASPQERRERLGQMATTPSGAAQLTAAGLGDVAQRSQALLPEREDPRQFAQDKREAMGMFQRLPAGRLDDATAKQLKAQISQARTQDELNDAIAAVPIGLGAKAEDIDTQVYRELTSGGMSGIEALKSISGAGREPPDPLDQDKKRLQIQKLQTEIADAKKGGLSDSDKLKVKNDVRTALRGEQVYKDYQDVMTGYTRVKIGARMGEGPGDLAIVNGVVRLLDPNSVVRPSEFQAAANAQGWLDWAKTWEGRVKSGSILSPETRQRFLQLAQQVHESHANRLTQEVGTVYGNMLEGTGVSLNELFIQPEVSSDTGPSGDIMQLGQPPTEEPQAPQQAQPQAAPSFTIKGIREKGQ